MAHIIICLVALIQFTLFCGLINLHILSVMLCLIKLPSVVCMRRLVKGGTLPYLFVSMRGPCSFVVGCKESSCTHIGTTRRLGFNSFYLNYVVAVCSGTRRKGWIRRLCNSTTWSLRLRLQVA